MKISRLLAQHKSFNHSKSLSLNFGDHYLYANNLIFKNIRDQFLKLGFELSLKPNPFYAALPLSQLDAVIESKMIPYLDNVSVLIDVESKLKAGGYWDDVSDQLKKNNLFHESCHCVARDMLVMHIGRNRDVLNILLEESFSNTCELLAVIPADSTEHKIFFEWNSFVCEFEDRVNLNRCKDELGLKVLFQFFIICYLHSNFLRDDFTDKVLSDVIKYLELNNPGTKIGDKNAKSLKALSRIAFRLNPRFRQITTHFYLRLQGLNKPLEELLDFDFFATIKSEAQYQKVISEMSEIASKS